MSLSSFGVIGRSRKKDESRVPIHPDHFASIPDDVAQRLLFEEGYGEPFAIPDDELAERFGGVGSRSELLSHCDGVVLPKPAAEDLRELRRGGILWGWPHCVQQQDVTRVAVEREQTLLAFEAMYKWEGGTQGVHLLYRNNEMAGYCGVIHAFSIVGLDGHYGPPLSAVVMGLGSASRGAIQALSGLGVGDIMVYTQRSPLTVRDRAIGPRYGQMVRRGDRVEVIEEGRLRRPLADTLAEADVIVNGTLQDTERPLMYISEGEEERLKRGALIVDISCDLGMGFPFARPTSFRDPTFNVGHVTYYSVDHTPTFMWRSASWEISHVVVAYLERVLQGPDAWEEDETLRRAIEVRAGKVLNPKILSFGRREGSAEGR